MAQSRPAWAEIDLSALRHNMLALKSLLAPACRFCAVVKADGYGHGAVEAARIAERVGADCLAVAVVDEAEALRRAGVGMPILLLGYTQPSDAERVAAGGFSQTIFSAEQAACFDVAARRTGRKVRVHLKIDTGLARIGVPPERAGDLATAAARCRGLEVEGAFTHFASSGDRDKAYTRKQLALFLEALDLIRRQGVEIPVRHAANSGAVIDLPETHLDMVRAGVAMYGLWPSEEVTRPFELKPAMRFRARVAMVKEVPAGTGVSYGLTYTTPGRARLATIPVGYADGWSRRLSNRGRVVLAGASAPIRGAVCMDQFVVDASGLDVREGDECLLFGGAELPAEEVAAHLDSINYEVVCMIGKRVPRAYVNGV